MRFLRDHWFGFLLSLFFGAYFVVFLLVLFAPTKDIQKRGFTKCSASLYNDLKLCDRSSWCLLKNVLINNWCNVTVVGDGVSAWVKGEQSTPWANYFFEPELPQSDEPHPELVKFYQESTDLPRQMNELKNKNKILEQEVLKHGESEQSSGLGLE